MMTEEEFYNKATQISEWMNNNWSNNWVQTTGAIWLQKLDTRPYGDLDNEFKSTLYQYVN